MAEHRNEGNLVRNFAIAASVLTALLVACIAYPYFARDRWEIDNRDRVVRSLNEADRLQQADPFGAYKTYDDVLTEAQQHTITDEDLSKRLATAEASRNALYQKVQDKIKEEEAEKRRRAEEEAKRVAREKQELAEGQQRKRAAEQSQRIADEKQRAEEKRRKEAVSVYRNAPQSARDALNAVKRVQARTEVGINYRDYSTVVGEAWADVKVFVESPEGQGLPRLSVLLTSAMHKYKLGLDVWRSKLDSERSKLDSESSLEEYNRDLTLRLCWKAADRRLEAAQSLISGDGAAVVLSRVATLPKIDATYEATMRSILIKLETADMDRKAALKAASLADMARKAALKAELEEVALGALEDYKEMTKRISEMIKDLATLAAKDFQGP